MGLVKSAFAGGMPCRPKLGNSGIWFWNIRSTVSFFRIWAPVIGDVPSLSKVARISVICQVCSSRSQAKQLTAVFSRQRKRPSPTTVHARRDVLLSLYNQRAV
jgi:hypothetical protein